MSNHLRNTAPMLASPRCGAKTRSGEPCRSPAVSGKKRCRMHGGAQGSGAPRGNQNALKTGRFTRPERTTRKFTSVRGFLSKFDRMVSDLTDIAAQSGSTAGPLNEGVSTSDTFARAGDLGNLKRRPARVHNLVRGGRESALA